MSLMRWQYKDTNDLTCVHVPSTNNTTTNNSDYKQVEYRFTNLSNVEQIWHRPAEAAIDSELVGRAVFPNGTNMDATKMSQMKFYLGLTPQRADDLGITHVEVKLKASRNISGITLRHNFLVQNPDGIPYDHNQSLQWEIVNETIDLITDTKTFVRKIPNEHIKHMVANQLYQNRSFGFFYWRMEGNGIWQPGDWIEFDFRFYCQP